ncbi:MAG TPA: PqqD family protein [Candidatus Phocaeicola excrementigallinarum]|nr:PqqD family protein [Candidatus Phocaeicola excrementigallinarum]
MERIVPLKGLTLREIGRQYMIVKVSEGSANLSNVFALNETAALLWRQLEQGNCTVDGLVRWMCREYEVDDVTAASDVKGQLDAWREYGLIV